MSQLATGIKHNYMLLIYFVSWHGNRYPSGKILRKKVNTMKWVEVICLRSVENRRELLDEFFRLHSETNERRRGLHKMSQYLNAFVENEICFHLQWEADTATPGKSDFGIELAAAFETFGRVYHTVWIEDERRWF